jgi:hypothetical protein
MPRPESLSEPNVPDDGHAGVEHGVAGELKPVDRFSLMDLAALRLVLRGESVVDWTRLYLPWG